MTPPVRRILRRGRIELGALCLLLGCSAAVVENPRPGPVPLFYSGADLSELDQLEARGAIFADGDQVDDALLLLRDRGLNAVRLRLWHDPVDGFCDLAATVRMAERIRAAGLRFLLDLHYSDTWADPGQQTKPAAWEGLSFDGLRDSVFTYTRDVIATLRHAGALPDVVQLGNEITPGMLWDEGRVDGAFDRPRQWNQLGELLRAAVEGVRAGQGVRDVSIMIHLDRGGDPRGARRFLDRLVERDIAFDAIGLSFYPWWHGTLADLERTLAMCAKRYRKPVMVVETAYPWTLDWFDGTHNSVGMQGQLHAGYPASVEGQTAFLRDLVRIVERTPRGLGRGVFYWAPEWIPAPGAGSPWENLALFDPRGNLLPSVDALRSAVGP